MFDDRLKRTIEQKLKFRICRVSSLSGGSIAESFLLETDDEHQFVIKTALSAPQNMFICEANGLRELAKARSLRTPEVLMVTDRWIVLEYLAANKKCVNFWQEFGRGLAKIHRYQGNSFGFVEDNYIGLSPQRNTPCIDKNFDGNQWLEFYWKNRLEFQFHLARKNGLLTAELHSLEIKLRKKIPEILEGSYELPCLLHGDLWSGNFLVGPNGEACLIDPAVYYGHREADLAMTKLFGGFAPEFYAAYEDEFPLKAGYQYRENLYKLYHVINHLNLFGDSYYDQAVDLILQYVRD